VALTSTWGEADIQEQLDGATRNKSIFEDIRKNEREWFNMTMTGYSAEQK
jgi:hypothetical protein